MRWIDHKTYGGEDSIRPHYLGSIGGAQLKKVGIQPRPWKILSNLIPQIILGHIVRTLTI